jgi:hypothetical protein
VRNARDLDAAARYRRRFDRRPKCVGIRAYLLQRQRGRVFQHFSEETFGGIEITLRRQQEIDGVSVLVDGAVQIAPFAADLEILT